MAPRAVFDHTSARSAQNPYFSVVPEVLDILRGKALLACCPSRVTPRASDMRHAEDVCMRQGSTRGSPSACPPPNDERYPVRQMLGPDLMGAKIRLLMVLNLPRLP
jgi:hypothetical protein